MRRRLTRSTFQLKRLPVRPMLFLSLLFAPALVPLMGATQLPKDKAPKDYKDELPRIPPKEPADGRVKVFTGFARDKAGEATMNSFRWGLDNRIHVCTSLAGGLVRRADEPKARPVNVRGQGFLFDPRAVSQSPPAGGAANPRSF